MDQKIEFVTLLQNGEISMSELCRRFSITRRTGYKWFNRFKQSGHEGLVDKSRRPYKSPNRTNKEIEALILKLRKADPEWGCKKIFKLLVRDYNYKSSEIPSKTTINNILKRNGFIDYNKSIKNREYQRFEKEHPNQLWQMDFKGDFLLGNKRRCFPLTITDDHSRYNLCLKALDNQRNKGVQDQLQKVFKQYGMPDKILCDNAGPWGLAGNHRAGESRITKLEKWLLQLNVKMIHGRPYHPQTQGKLERYHRTLKTELLKYNTYDNIIDCQESFDKWKYKYNHIRPHESLDQETPASKYLPSLKSYPDKIEEPKYLETDFKRKVCGRGFISFKGKVVKIGKALCGDSVAIRQESKNEFSVHYISKKIKSIKFNNCIPCLLTAVYYVS